MHPRKIILFSSNTEQVNLVFEWISSKFQLHHFPLLYQLTASDLRDKPALILFADCITETKLSQKVLDVKRKLPEVPILLWIGEINTNDLLLFFRSGIKDVLTGNVSKDDLLNKINQHAILPYQTKRFWKIFFHFIFLCREKLVTSLIPFLKKRNHRSAAALGIMPNEHFSKIIKESFRSSYDLKVQFFGNLDIEVRGKKLNPIAGKKVKSLLAYLLYYHKKPVHRDILMERFWGDNAPSSARNSLNVAIHAIRRHFLSILPQQDLLVYKNECYAINSDLDIISDVEQFTAYWQKGSITEQNQDLEEALGAYNKAVGLYRGDFLEELLYEEWCEAERDNLKETFLLILDRQSNFFFNQGGYSVAINICKKMLKKDPCLEEVYRKIITCYKQLGLRDKAIRWCYKCEQTLKEELGIKPSQETLLLFESLKLNP